MAKKEVGKKAERLKPLSLYGIEPEEALRAMMEATPQKPTAKQKTKHNKTVNATERKSL